MRVHVYALAHWPDDRRATPRVVPPALYREAQDSADILALVVAVSKAHAMRLWHEGAEAVRGADGKLERCGVLPSQRGGWADA